MPPKAKVRSSGTETLWRISREAEGDRSRKSWVSDSGFHFFSLVPSQGWGCVHMTCKHGRGRGSFFFLSVYVSGEVYRYSTISGQEYKSIFPSPLLFTKEIRCSHFAMERRAGRYSGQRELYAAREEILQ